MATGEEVLNTLELPKSWLTAIENGYLLEKKLGKGSFG